MSYYSGVILADSPIRYYPLDDAAGSATLADKSGNGQNGTLHGGVTLGQSSLTAVTGTAALFDGSSGYVALPLTGLPSGSQPWSVEAWASLASPLEGARGVPLGFGTYALKEMAELQFYAGGPNQWALSCYSFDISGPANGALASTTYHLVGTYDGSHTRLYVNGVLVATSNTATALTVTIAFASIGAGNTSGSSDRFKGTLQHAAIYNYALSAAQVSTHYSAGVTGPRTYYALIGGVNVTLTPGSLNVENQIGQRSTGSMHVTGPLGTIWQYGTSVQLYDATGTLVYTGFVHKDQATKDPGLNAGAGLLDHDLTLMDNAYKADKRVIFASYLNASAGFIVQDLVNRVLYQEGVTYTAQSVALGPTIPEVIWNGKQISSALDWLAKNAGYWWNIDLNSVLWFQPYGGVPAPFTMDGTQAEANPNLKVTYGNDLYVNTQYTKGGSAEKGTKKAPLYERLYGDGHRTSFTLGYPVSTLYQVLLDGVDVTAKSLTKGSGGGSFYYAPGDAVIAQDPSQSVLTSSDYLDVYYAGKVPAIGKAQNSALIAAQKAREGSGSSGIVESVYADTKVHTLPAALQIAAALLAHYGADTTVLEFDTLTPGLLEGQLLPVNLPDFALINRQMLISDVALSDQLDGYNVWSHVTAVGSPLDSAQFQTFWQNLMNQQSDPTDLSDTADQQLTPIATTAFAHTPSFATRPQYGSPVTSPVCGVTSGPHTMVCGQWTCS